VIDTMVAEYGYGAASVNLTAVGCGRSDVYPGRRNSRLLSPRVSIHTRV
jgi:hypothetical protein